MSKTVVKEAVLVDKYNPELRRVAAAIVKNQGVNGLKEFVPQIGLCACMGAVNGEYMCGCVQKRYLYKHLPVFLSEHDEELGRRLMLERLVSALPG